MRDIDTQVDPRLADTKAVVEVPSESSEEGSYEEEHFGENSITLIEEEDPDKEADEEVVA